MKKRGLILVALLMLGLNVKSQRVVWPPESIISLTSEWTGERTSDGRPKVPDQLLERFKYVPGSTGSTAGGKENTTGRIVQMAE